MERIDDLERGGIELSDEGTLPDPQYGPTPITLQELRSCLLEDLDLSLDTTGRPMTFDSKRVSRDPEHWTALATFGHPELRPALAKLAQAGVSNKALVITQAGPLAVAFRADRAPPEQVRTVTELFDIGEPVAVGDAESAAAAEIETANQDQFRQEQRLIFARRERWDRQIRRRFRQLVARAINAEAVIRLRRDGEPADPQLLWFGLNQDANTGWNNADFFRQYLDLELAEILPRPTPNVDQRSERELVRVRAETGNQLLALVKEWMAVTMPEVLGGPWRRGGVGPPLRPSRRVAHGALVAEVLVGRVGRPGCARHVLGFVAWRCLDWKRSKSPVCAPVALTAPGWIACRLCGNDNTT